MNGRRAGLGWDRGGFRRYRVERIESDRIESMDGNARVLVSVCRDRIVSYRIHS